MNSTHSKWRGKYKTLEEYYRATYDPEYYCFDKYELTVDPDEPADDIENYDGRRQKIEYAKCAMSFPYFCLKYVKIMHPKHGLIPFLLYKYQKEVIEQYEQHRFTIIKKFRQGGLTTVSEIWSIWRCLFKLDQQILFLSKTDREAVAAGEIVNNATKHLPAWMRPDPNGKWNDHKKQFLETGGFMHFIAPGGSRGLAITYLIVDEAAFIDDMDKHWRAMYPTLSTGGNCIIISTVNGLGNWYERTYHEAENKENDFHIIDLHYKKHPDYNNDKWVAAQKAQLHEKGWQQEILGNFLGSGETYIPDKILGDLLDFTKNNEPKRKKMKKWANLGEESRLDPESKGALWFWKEPQEGHEYIMAADCAEGIGSEGDNSCLQVFDNSTLEQVAEFYSNSVQPHLFAQVINEIAIYYNHAMVIVENMGPGGAVLNNLQFDLFYDNLFYEPTSGKKTPKPGIKVTQGNRPVILEAMQHRLMNGTVRVNSRRLVRELTTFKFDPETSKVAAEKGCHDDAVIALALALYVRDSIIREIPMGADVPVELAAIKSLSYEEIKREIMEGAPRIVKEEKKDYLSSEEESSLGFSFSFNKKYHRIKAEFGWD